MQQIGKIAKRRLCANIGTADREIVGPAGAAIGGEDPDIGRATRGREHALVVATKRDRGGGDGPANAAFQVLL